MEISIYWILCGILGLGVGIGILAGTMWRFMKARLEVQDQIIEAQNRVIKNLQDEVGRLSKGLGIDPSFSLLHFTRSRRPAALAFRESHVFLPS